MPDGTHITTLDDLIANFGPPSDGGGGDVAVACAKRAADDHRDALDAVLEAPMRENRELTAAESRTFKVHEEQISQLRAAAQLWGGRQRAAAAIAVELGQTGERHAQRANGGFGMGGYHTGGGRTYERGNNQVSWVRDLIDASLRNDPDAGERLRRNNREVAMEHRALNATDGTGGDFVPPGWYIDQWIRLARPGRVIADQVAQMALPPGTDSVNLPRLATGTSTAEQSSQNTAVSNTDATTNSVTAAVATLAGQQVVSLQLIEQSPVNTDEILLADLMADLATRTDAFVINNNATNKVGLLNVAGANAVTFTTPVTVAAMYPKIADGIQRVSTSRYLPPQKIFMHPRRWAWLTAAVDGNGRPLVVPTANMPQNVLSAQGDVVTAEGFVGLMQGLPVFQDPNIPTNLGASTTEDRIIIARTDDIILMEGVPRAEIFRQPFAGSMGVLLRVYNYVALHASRYPASLSIISGAGLVPPTF